MVCKEEVLLWFKDLDSHNRIDVLYEILNMCLPFEIRFIGTCIEELGKHTYQELRGPAIIANDLEKLSKDVSLSHGISDESVRHRLLIYLSLLSSRNHSVASWLYRKLLRTECIEEYLVKDKGKDDTLHSEFLLLFTMALHHPAFTFEHKQFFSKILVGLIDIRENRISPRHCSLGYPPGFGYPTFMNVEMPLVPVKTAPTPCGDSPSVFHHPPGLQHRPPQTPPPPSDCIPPVWNRPGFPYGAPEVPPFPAPAISPLVSQAASPSQSRNTSPHRTVIGRPPTSAPPILQPHTNGPLTSVPPPMTCPPLMCRPPPPLVVDVLGGAAPLKLPHEQPPQSVFGSGTELKTAEEDPMKVAALEEKHLRDILWPQHPPTKPEPKPNGVRLFPPFAGKVRPYIVDQMQAMNLDGEHSLHHSNSSSNSSPNETPPGTPRGTAHTRANGEPPFGAPAPHTFPQPFATLPPNRSIFPFHHPSFRPAFAAPYPGFAGDAFPPYAVPYFHLMYSSPYQRRPPPSCCNCGAAGHLGGECREQNVEEITEKKAYRLEFNSAVPDAGK